MKNSYCLETSIAIMKYTGVWIPDVGGMRHKWSLLYILYAVFIQGFLFLFIVVAEIGYVFTVIGDTERTVDAAVLLLSHLVEGVKILTIYCRQRRIKLLIQFINGPEFKNFDKRKTAMLERTIKMAATAGHLVISAAGVTGLFWCIVPALKPELTLPLKTAYPFDISNPKVFGVLYGYSSISVTAVGVIDAAVNYLVAGLMILGVAQLDVLCEELTEIGADSNENDSSYKETVSCIKRHQNIIKYIDELAAIFGLPIFCQFMISSVIVCMTLYKITITKEPIELTTMIFYLICVFIELLMYCYPGDLLINKSLQVAEAAFSNKWTRDIRSRRALCLVTMRAQRALMVNAGGLFKVSLPTAAGVVQTAYSYYAVLQKIENK